MSGSSSPREIDLRDYLLVLRRRKWIIIGVTLAVGVLAFALAEFRAPVYASTAKVLIQKPSPQLDPANANRTSPDLIAEIEQQFFDGDAVKHSAQDKLGYPAECVASATGRGSVLQITATDHDPQKAADKANRCAESYIEVRRKSSVDDYAATAQAAQAKIDDIDKQLAGLDTAGPTTVAPFPGAKPPTTTVAPGSAVDRANRESLIAQKEALEKSLSNLQVGQGTAQLSGPQIISPGKVSAAPVSPNIKRDTLLGFLGGLLLGIAAAFLVDFLDDSIKSRSDLEAVMGDAPILAIIPYLQDWRNRSEAHLASIEKPSSPTAEAYRTLRIAIQFAGLERELHAVQVTSPRSQDGKTTTSANLAVALARAGLRVILIDCDLRRPRVHEFFGLRNEVGFTSVLLGQSSIESAVQKVEGIPYLRFLASGPAPPNPSELLSGRKAGELVDSLKQAADVVVFDTPPVLPVSDALVISDLMDAVIMVIAAGSTTKKEAHRAYELLAQVDAPLIGTVLNSRSGRGGYGETYGNRYGYSSEYKPTAHDASAESKLERSSNGAGTNGGNGASHHRPGSVEVTAPVPKTVDVN